MAYQNNFVATIKSSGKILRENKDVVAVPFGAEYSIYLKNLSSVRAIANVWIDGVDVTDGNWVIVDANSGLDLARYIRDGNFDRGNKFKFIERTSQIEEHRGIGAEDGLVRVEYKFEIPQTLQVPPYYTIWNAANNGSLNSNINYTSSSSPRPSFSGGSMLRSRSLKSSGPSGQTHKAPEMHATNCCVTSTTTSGCLGDSVMSYAETSLNDVGITVPGGVSNQKFVQGPYFPTEAVSHVIVLKLVGKVKGQKIEKPVTVETKPTCETCGKLNKATHKFCDRCGTALQLF